MNEDGIWRGGKYRVGRMVKVYEKRGGREQVQTFKIPVTDL